MSHGLPEYKNNKKYGETGVRVTESDTSADIK